MRIAVKLWNREESCPYVPPTLSSTSIAKDRVGESNLAALKETVAKLVHHFQFLSGRSRKQQCGIRVSGAARRLG
jgi:hypothetical protein